MKAMKCPFLRQVSPAFRLSNAVFLAKNFGPYCPTMSRVMVRCLNTMGDHILHKQGKLYIRTESLFNSELAMKKKFIIFQA